MTSAVGPPCLPTMSSADNFGSCVASLTVNRGKVMMTAIKTSCLETGISSSPNV